jgi:Ni,Fe-hydrogenase III small subunit
MQNAVRNAYKVIQEPKVIIALGDGAIKGDDRFTNCLSVKDVLGRVDLEIPGNPATAKEILSYLVSFTKKI